MDNLMLSARSIKKSYAQGISELQILRGIDFDVRSGDAVCIVGSSGAGKSTLLDILGTLDRPNEGRLFLQGQDVIHMSDDEISQFRNKELGFVFQFHHLLSEFNALENVMLPLRIAGEDKTHASGMAEQLLTLVGLKDRMLHFPNQLSGGELQRVAIARALVRSPKLLFADEPTGNLDSVNAAHIQNLFFELKEKLGLTLIVVTHDLQFARKFGKVMRITDGLWDTRS